ncbi:hypothetical protein [Metabacillus bambusae]|uniref:Uncharacterized protein n=1 Tax=Metabacillus bambusae TaxID=2795218 RepID=A0ABS3N276_9BACI|nr:hypothetical protein [Metabacillus bambusae]MBO1512387.1 hypothetical protein [Metabacillus bambusae]
MTGKINENRPLVLEHQAIRFETAQSWNPASSIGKIPENNGNEPSGGHPVGPINPGQGGNNNNSPWP